MTLLCYRNLQTWVFCCSFDILLYINRTIVCSRHLDLFFCSCLRGYVLLQCSVCEYYRRQMTSRWPWWAVCWSLSCVTVTMTTDRCCVTTWRYWRQLSRSGDQPFKCQLRESTSLLNYTVTLLLLLVCQGSAATCWRSGGKYCMNFIGNLTDFPAVKEFWKSVKIWQN